MSLSAIVDDLALHSVVVGGVAPTVYYKGTLPASASTAQTPCRLVFTADPNGKGSTGEFVAVGTMTSARFTLSDLMLWRPVAQGIGRANVDEYFIQYVDNYQAMLRTWRDAGQSAAVLNGWTATPGVFEYPEGSGMEWWGVLFVLTITEYNG
jgi:hypothetical protein